MTDDTQQLPDDAIEFAHKLFDAARSGEADFLLSAIDTGVPVDLADEKGNTFLMLAAYHGHPNVVDGLLARGADPNRLNARNQSPVAGAVFKRHESITETLIKHGADIDAGAPSARTAANMFGITLDTP